MNDKCENGSFILTDFDHQQNLYCKRILPLSMDITLIKQGEGYRSEVYKCTEGYSTIGYGHKITSSDGKLEQITLEQAEKLLEQDLLRARKEVKLFFGEELLESIGEARSAVLIDMAFNMGSVRWPKLTAALKKGDYDRASEQIMNSKYASQVGKRAKRNAAIMKTGQLLTKDDV